MQACASLRYIGSKGQMVLNSPRWGLRHSMVEACTPPAYESWAALSSVVTTSDSGRYNGSRAREMNATPGFSLSTSFLLETKISSMVLGMDTPGKTTDALFSSVVTMTFRLFRRSG